MSLLVEEPGLLTTVQDLGRPGHQREGVPVGGAVDALALRVANLLVGNPDGAAALEITLTGPVLRFAHPALVALAGADLGAEIDGTPILPWRPFAAPPAGTLRFRGAPRGCRAYLAVAGGIDVPPVMGSRSTYPPANLGGHQGRALRAGDQLQWAAPPPLAQRILRQLRREHPGVAVARWGAGPSLRPPYVDRPVVRLLAGAHADALSEASGQDLFRSEFRVSARSDRMGYRLEGPQLRLREPLEPLSEAVAFGTLQLPPGGEPIVLMADRQTTGGYPRIGEVASVDLPLLAQLKPGDRLAFRPVELAEAQMLYLARERDLTLARRAIDLMHR